MTKGVSEMWSGRGLIQKGIRRLLNLATVVYGVLIPVVIMTGGFKLSVLGMNIRVTHISTPLKILILLIILQIMVRIKIKDAILLFVSLFLALTLVEITVRIWNPPNAKPGLAQIHRASSTLGWELTPGSYGVGSLGEVYKINGTGLRDREYPLQKPADVFRVVVVGDSFTFGMGVNLEESYPKKMEAMLRQWKPNCEVLNFGVTGYNMWQYHELLVSKVLSHQPDVVILGLFLDDLLASQKPHQQSGDWGGKNPFIKTGFMSRFSFWNLITNTSALLEHKYRYLRGYSYIKDIRERKKTWGPANPSNPFYRVMSGKWDQEGYIQFSASFQRFISEARKSGIKPLVAFIPDSVQLHDPLMQAINLFIKDVCGTIDVPFLDLTPILEAEKDSASLYLFPFDAHNSPKGLDLIAEGIVRRMVELGMPPS